MRAVILDGSRSEDGECLRATEALRGALERSGHEVAVLPLRDLDIRECTACFTCWLRTPGECALKDDGATMLRAVVNADIELLVTRVSFGGYGGLLKTALDRIVPSALPTFTMRDGEMHHPLRYEPMAAFGAVGLQADDNPECAATFESLVERNARNMDPGAFGATVLRECDDDEARDAAIAELLGRLGVGGR